MRHPTGLLQADRKAQRHMTRPDKLKWVKHLLMDWADREDKLMRSSIGYPKQSVEAQQGTYSAGIKGAKHPEVMMTRRISHCDRAVKALKPELRQVIHYKYEQSGRDDEKQKRYTSDTGISRTIYYERLEKAHKAVADWVWSNA